ncbi:hypothetical protein, partial [Escherichia coli]|uniref:hypothetical protein n=1 Tax=Escherichia coli TaxID=562 RepID=UPI001C386599
NKDRFGKLTSKSLDSIAALGLREADAELPCLFRNNSIEISSKHLQNPYHLWLLSFLQTSKNPPLLWHGTSNILLIPTAFQTLV